MSKKHPLSREKVKFKTMILGFLIFFLLSIGLVITIFYFSTKSGSKSNSTTSSTTNPTISSTNSTTEHTENKLEKLGLDESSISKFKKEYEEDNSNDQEILNPVMISKMISADTFEFLKIYFVDLEKIKIHLPTSLSLSDKHSDTFERYINGKRYMRAIFRFIHYNVKAKSIEIKGLTLPLPQEPTDNEVIVADETARAISTRETLNTNLFNIVFLLFENITERIALGRLFVLSKILWAFGNNGFNNILQNEIPRAEWEENINNKIDLTMISSFPNITNGLSYTLLYLLLRDTYVKQNYYKKGGKDDEFAEPFYKEDKEYERFGYIVGLIYKLLDIISVNQEDFDDGLYKEYVEGNTALVEAILNKLESEFVDFLKYFLNLFKA